MNYFIIIAVRVIISTYAGSKLKCSGEPTKVKHVVPALTEDVPGFREQLVQPAWHSHRRKCHHKHGVDGLDETLCLFRDNRIQATNPGFKQH